VHISLQGLYCSCEPVFCSHVTLTGYPLHYLFSPSLPLPCVTVCHQISNAVYQLPTFFITVRLSNMAEGNRAFSNERNRSLHNFPNYNPRVAISLHPLWKRRWMFQTLRVFLVILLRSWSHFRTPTFNENTQTHTPSKSTVAKSQKSTELTKTGSLKHTNFSEISPSVRTLAAVWHEIYYPATKLRPTELETPFIVYILQRLSCKIATSKFLL
jgi:hypothetical protein